MHCGGKAGSARPQCCNAGADVIAAYGMGSGSPRVLMLVMA